LTVCSSNCSFWNINNNNNNNSNVYNEKKLDLLITTYIITVPNKPIPKILKIQHFKL